MRIAILTASALLLAGCNTVEGFGRDLGAAGDALSGAARDARDHRTGPNKCRTEAGRPTNISACRQTTRR